ncbi:DUF3857 domain-containing protein [Pedobacter antarcticus]|uniref:DUF3857 domain-containing protein n=1 Tax=Pedobacter antarcticus TaxID=34086 RepID=UPI00292D7C3A|nr:DUF3857 domain-containing protein [Pedobacter antarcticus]
MIRIYRLSFICWLLCTSTLNAQQKYDSSNIPADLSKNAAVVVRNEEQNVLVKNERSLVQTYSIVMTIMNAQGDYAASISEYYDPFSVLSNLKASLYDAKGVLVKTFKSTDFKDQSLISEGTLFDQYRKKQLTFLHSTYPYTIAYSFERTFDGYLTFPGWQPVSNFGQSVEKSSYTFQIPQQLTFRYKTSNGLQTDSLQKDQKSSYSWTSSQIPAVLYEPYSTGVATITPWVKLSPDQFDFDRSKGTIRTWENMGSWIDQLNQNGQLLPEQTKIKIRSMIAGAKNDQEKIAILYQYLQSNTRYVGIQLGIGGFKPIAAEKVAAVNYGDCKALSNYMKSMLAVAGISSNLVVLGSGRPSLDSKFSSFTQANHMILCVPGKQDTTWLECTSNYKPAGYIGYANAGRQVLLIKSGGGELVGTPVFKPEDNTQRRTAEILLDESGAADIKINTSYAYAQYEDNLYRMLEEPVNQRKKIIQELSIPNLELNNFSYQQPDKNLPVINESISLKSSQLTTTGGGKIFLAMNLLNKKEFVPQKTDGRKTSFSLPYGYEDTDEIHFKLPVGFAAEFIPKDIELKSPFGTYSTKIVQKGNELIYTRKLLIRNSTYSASQYNNLVDFYKQIYQADKQKAVLVKM